MYWENMWTFETENLRITWDITPEDDLDLSWDETGEVAEKLDTGEFTAFTSRVQVVHKVTGAELSVAYLGASIYSDPADFRDHIGIRAKGRADGCSYGSYFSDMVREAVAEARETLRNMQTIRTRV